MADPIHPLAASVIARAACSERSLPDAGHCRIRLTGATRQEVMACLPLLDGVVVTELEDGSLEYVGPLPSRLILALELPAGVPPVDIDGGESA